MRLRSIILTLTFIAFLLAILGGYFYYTRVKNILTSDASQLANYKITDSKGRFTTFIAEQLKPVRALAGLPEVRLALKQPDNENILNVNKILDLFKITLEADVCYLMDTNGLTIASSNRLDKDSFVGESFAFRPYFKEAVRGSSSLYMALGIESKKRGVYYSFPVVDGKGRQTIGVAVIKASVEKIENELVRTISPDETLLLTDPHGIIFITSNKDWLFHSLWKLTDEELVQVAESKQFGNGPWDWLGFYEHSNDNRLVNSEGEKLLFYDQYFEPFPEWRIVYLRKLPSTFANLLAPFKQTTGLLLFFFFLLVISSVVILYQKAHSEIVRRKDAEKALTVSEKRFRRLYLHTPALLHSIGPDGNMVSISDYWSEVLGYGSEEVIGKQITDFMTPESRQRAEESVIPQFFLTGFCKDVPYNFVKKNGEIIDVLLSAIAEYDEQGNISRSLAVMVDITELKKAEEKLKEAGEELSRYSLDLESQVRKRTTEISNILRYTPAVVSLKDTEGKYLLVNSRFEKLFGMKMDAVRGKRDSEIFDHQIADQFEHNDQQVFANLEPLQIEETVPLDDGNRTYLSVKFPLFDDTDNVIGIGGISTDITDLKQAQEKLRLLSNKIVTSQEKERAAIARELHDELGQALSALRMDAVWLSNKLEETRTDVASRARAMSELIDKTIDEVRNMAVRLRPGVLDDLGLFAALEWLVDDFEKRFAIPCTFRQHTVPDLNDMISTAVYRITQEALTNSARHADASHVEVVLEMRNDNLCLDITDNGKGFDIKTLDEAEGLGLAGIRERASLIDASVVFNSEPGKGSKIQVCLALDNEKRLV